MEAFQHCMALKRCLQAFPRGTVRTQAVRSQGSHPRDRSVDMLICSFSSKAGDLEARASKHRTPSPPWVIHVSLAYAGVRRCLDPASGEQEDSQVLPVRDVQEGQQTLELCSNLPLHLLCPLIWMCSRFLLQSGDTELGSNSGSASHYLYRPDFLICTMGINKFTQ